MNIIYKNKFIVSLIIIGLCCIMFSNITNAKSTESPYNKKCLDWGNKYDGGSMIVTTYQTKEMAFGQIFRCNGAKTVNTVLIHFSSATGWSLPTYRLNVSIRYIDNDTGLPLGNYLANNVTIKPISGWNVINYPLSFDLHNNTYYAIYVLDMNKIMASSVNVKPKLICDSKSHILGRSPDGYYEPFDRSFTIARPSSPVVYTEGSMPWIVCFNRSGTYESLEGNCYDSLTGAELFDGYEYRQSFIPDYTFNATMLTTPLGVFEYDDYVLDGKIWVNISNSTGTIIQDYIELCKDFELGVYPSDRTVYRYYTCYFEEIIKFIKGNKYFISVCGNNSRDNEVTVPQLTTTNNKLYSLTYQNTTCNMSYRFEGGSWNWLPNHDMIFSFSVLDMESIPSNDIDFKTNLNNVTGGYEYYYNNDSGFMLYINYTGNITPIFLYQNIFRVNGSHHYNLTNIGYKVYANYTNNITGLVIVDNTINTTGTIEYVYSNNTGVNGEWWVWINKTGTGNFSNILIKINVSGFNGNISWFGFPVNQTNITDIVNSNTSYNGTVKINEDYYFLSGILTFENQQFFLFVFLFLWLLLVFRYIDNRIFKISGILAWFQLAISFPISLFVFSLAYINSQPFGYIFGFMIPIVSLYIIADHIYNKKFKR